MLLYLRNSRSSQPLCKRPCSYLSSPSRWSHSPTDDSPKDKDELLPPHGAFKTMNEWIYSTITCVSYYSIISYHNDIVSCQFKSTLYNTQAWQYNAPGMTVMQYELLSNTLSSKWYSLMPVAWFSRIMHLARKEIWSSNSLRSTRWLGLQIPKISTQSGICGVCWTNKSDP